MPADEKLTAFVELEAAVRSRCARRARRRRRFQRGSKHSCDTDAIADCVKYFDRVGTFTIVDGVMTDDIPPHRHGTSGVQESREKELH